MTELDAAGLIWYPDSKAKRPRLKRYLDEQEGVVVGNVWSDIPPINSRAAERLGYPTQKPLRLLERIIAASSNPGDLVLDPFCGCGTTVDAAQKLGRPWIGIDVTYIPCPALVGRIRQR
jgi:site-specific DNA-methyltransferase (adenine-specific)